jgi:hypothetical protein
MSLEIIPVIYRDCDGATISGILELRKNVSVSIMP